eukprot:8039437-Pyramimonas_sp.AAC.1
MVSRCQHVDIRAKGKDPFGSAGSPAEPAAASASAGTPAASACAGQPATSLKWKREPGFIVGPLAPRIRC